MNYDVLFYSLLIILARMFVDVSLGAFADHLHCSRTKEHRLSLRFF